MNRRKFIKTGLQVGGAGLMASTRGCQGSLFDSFAQTATEAIVAETGATRQIFRVNLNTGVTSVVSDGVIFVNNLQSIALLDEDTALVTTNLTAGGLYKVNLKNNTVQLLVSGYSPGASSRGIALENRNSLLIGSNDDAIRRMDLRTLSVINNQAISVSATAIALESESSALLLDTGNTLYRLNLIDFSVNTLISPLSGSLGRSIALDLNRNIALIGQSDATQIERFDLSTNTQLSTDIGSLPDGAGRGIALENSNSVLVGNNSIPSATPGGLYRVDLDTGATSQVDDGTLDGVLIRAIAVRFQ